MKKKYFFCLLLFTGMLFSSCVSSLYSISDNENDFLFREELIGHWADKDMKTQIIVQRAANKKYSVAVIEKKKNSISDSSYFSGFLIQLDNQYFFDCTPDTDHPQFDCMGEETKSGLLPLNFIYKVHSIDKNELRITGMDIDSMQKFINKNKNMIKYEKPGKDHILVTADAVRLQKKILMNKEAAFIFSEPTILKRIK